MRKSMIYSILKDDHTWAGFEPMTAKWKADILTIGLQTASGQVWTKSIHVNRKLLWFENGVSDKQVLAAVNPGPFDYRKEIPDDW